jgi:hypothetical protein
MLSARNFRLVFTLASATFLSLMFVRPASAQCDYNPFGFQGAAVEPNNPSRPSIQPPACCATLLESPQVRGPWRWPAIRRAVFAPTILLGCTRPNLLMRITGQPEVILLAWLVVTGHIKYYFT